MCAEVIDESSPAECFIERVPSEILAKSISLLPFSSYLKCYRVCKAFLNAIKGSLVYMPKTTVTSVSIEHTDSTITLVVNRARYNHPRKSWSCVFVKDENVEDASTSTNTVAEFFDKQGLSGMKWDAASKSVEFRVPVPEDSLAHYLRFICSKAAITLLTTTDLSDAGASRLADVLKSCGSRVFHLKMVLRRAISAEVVELIRVTGCETIDIRREVRGAVDLLLKTPSVVAKMWSLTLLGETVEELHLTDDFLLTTSADVVTVRGHTAITEEGVRRFVKQWLAGSRKIQNVTMGATLCQTSLGTELESLGATKTSESDWEFRRKEGLPLTVSYSASDKELTIFLEPDEEGEDEDEEQEDFIDDLGK